MLCRAAKDKICKRNCQTHLYRACLHKNAVFPLFFYVGIFKYMWRARFWVNFALILIQIVFYDNFMVPFFTLHDW